MFPIVKINSTRITIVTVVNLVIIIVIPVKAQTKKTVPIVPKVIMLNRKIKTFVSPLVLQVIISMNLIEFELNVMLLA